MATGFSSHDFTISLWLIIFHWKNCPTYACHRRCVHACVRACVRVCVCVLGAFCFVCIIKGYPVPIYCFTVTYKLCMFCVCVHARACLRACVHARVCVCVFVCVAGQEAGLMMNNKRGGWSSEKSIKKTFFLRRTWNIPWNIELECIIVSAHSRKEVFTETKQGVCLRACCSVHFLLPSFLQAICIQG